MSSKQISRILPKKKYVYIWAKSSLEDKQNTEERAVFRDKLETYLKAGEVATDIFQVWFWVTKKHDKTDNLINACTNIRSRSNIPTEGCPFCSSLTLGTKQVSVYEY